MDAFDFADERPARPGRDTSLVWNVLTVVMLVGVFCVGVVFLTIMINPQAGLNPYPPATLLPTIAYPTATVTPRFEVQPSWTPTEVGEPTATSTPKPTSTPILSETPFGWPTSTPGPSETPSQWSFVLQQGSPASIPSLAFHPEAGCNWMGVAGQATSLSGEPVKYLFVQLGGNLQGGLYETKTTMTGAAPQYGQGGFEFTISDRVIASNGTLWIQLLDQANLPLSDKIYFNTYDDCEKNLTIIYFTQIK